MKPVYERDIPQLQGKTQRERMALYRQASQIDRRIVWRQAVLFSGLFALLAGLLALNHCGIIPSVLLIVAIFFGLGVPLLLYLRPRWVTPLIKDAMEKMKE